MRLRPIVLAVVALVGSLLPPRGSPEETGRADRVFLNGHIWTGDRGRPFVEALAIRGTTVLAVGGNGTVRRLAGKGTDVVDLGHRLVVPGFIDAHVHLLSASLALTALRLDGAETQAEIASRVAAWVSAHRETPWVTGRGWSYAAFGGGLPTRAALDAVVGARPAWLVSYDSHAGWASSAALRLAGIDRTTKDPPGGVIVRDAAGEPTGVLEEAAQDLVARLLPKPLALEKRRALERGLAQAAAWGLTGVHQAGIAEEDLEPLMRALEDFPLLRVYAALEMDRTPTPERLAHQLELRQRYTSRRLRIGAVKGYVDGVVEARTAAMFEPYPSGGTGRVNMTQEQLDRAVAAYDAAGWQVLLHAIGDRAVDMALTAYERAARASGSRARRHRVEHLEVPRLSDLARFRADEVVASTQAPFAYPDKNHFEAYLPLLGPERASRALCFRAIDDAGARQAFGSDWPVYPADVLRGIACAVTRTTTEGTPAGGWEPAQRLSVEAALRHYTCDAAYAERAESEKGTLLPGRAADLVVLSQDLFRIPPERIKDTQVLLTVLGGQDTWRAKELWR